MKYYTQIWKTKLQIRLRNDSKVTMFASVYWGVHYKL